MINSIFFKSKDHALFPDTELCVCVTFANPSHDLSVLLLLRGVL